MVAFFTVALINSSELVSDHRRTKPYLPRSVASPVYRKVELGQYEMSFIISGF
jgi:hypothetical protein